MYVGVPLLALESKPFILTVIVISDIDLEKTCAFELLADMLT